MTGRDSEALVSTVSLLEREGSPDAFGVQVDLQNSVTIDALFRQIEARWGALNTLVI